MEVWFEDPPPPPPPDMTGKSLTFRVILGWNLNGAANGHFVRLMSGAPATIDPHQNANDTIGYYLIQGAETSKDFTVTCPPGTISTLLTADLTYNANVVNAPSTSVMFSFRSPPTPEPVDALAVKGAEACERTLVEAVARPGLPVILTGFLLEAVGEGQLLQVAVAGRRVRRHARLDRQGNRTAFRYDHQCTAAQDQASLTNLPDRGRVRTNIIVPISGRVRPAGFIRRMPDMAEKITPRATNYPQWYLDIVKEAGLADNSQVRGCMVIRPTGYALWEKMQRGLDKLFKDTGHVNAYFPLFIPMSYLAKEEQMAEGFAKECAVVTHYRLKAEKGKPLHVDPSAELEEPLIVRPTSETIIWRTYKDWIQSYRDLPLLINQWCNVVRWEMRTRLFLRTAEFLWQEGHTAHATQKEAEDETLTMVRVYQKFAEEFMAMPVLVGPKTDGQKFPGAVYTLCIEAMMQDGKALQAGTSHFLGQNFAKAFDVTFKNEKNAEEFAWATSWGVSTRLIGGLIMTHSDDNGLVLPPRLAPVHVAIVPLGRNDAERGPSIAAAEKLAAELKALPRDEFFSYEPISVKIDLLFDKQPGFRYAEHELRGVPVRVEIGPKDIEKNACAVARRDVPGKEGKQFGIPLAGAADHIAKLLRDIQKSLFDRAKGYRDARTVTANSLDEFKQLFPVRKDENEELPIDALRFVSAHYDGSREVEDMVQKEYKATIRCLPNDGDVSPGTCIFTGKPSARRVVFARAY